MSGACDNKNSFAISVQRHVDEICLRFERAWKAGQRPAVEEYLGDAPEPERTLLCQELIAVEIAYRRRAGETPREEEYQARFPSLDLRGRLDDDREPASDDSLPEISPLQHPPTARPEVPDTLSAPEGNAGGLTSPALGQLGQYQLLEEIGHGGMGTVYKARHVLLKRTVAVKVLLPERVQDASAVARFHREMEVVGKLDHPNLVHATDAGEAAGQHFLVMEFLEGIDLRKLLKERGPLAVADACELTRQAALGLQQIHEHGLVHRDLKPSNLLLTHAGQVKVLDLGLALLRGDHAAVEELTSPGQTMGTWDYLAPEQATDTHTVDIRADIYSLGCTLYTLLAGQPPFRGPLHRTIYQKVRAHAEEPVPPLGPLRPDVPEALLAILDRMMAKAPAERFATPAEIAAAVAPFAAGCNVSALLSPALPEASPRGAATGSPPVLGSTGIRSQPAAPASSPTARSARPRPLRSVFTGMMIIGTAGLAVLVAAALIGWLARDRVPNPSLPELKGYLDVRIREEGNANRQNLRLSQKEALPVKVGDWIRFEAQLNRPAYLYLVSIDTQGKAQPAYPWKAGNWQERPADEKARARLSVPEAPDEWGQVTAGPPGMETLMLLARDDRLPVDVPMATLFAGLPTPTLQHPRAAVWFENGAVVRDEVDRAVSFFETKRSDDPVLRTQALLRERLQPYFRYTRAVSFANQGK
jgi:serine/threonine protein kinase